MTEGTVRELTGSIDEMNGTVRALEKEALNNLYGEKREKVLALIQARKREIIKAESILKKFKDQYEKLLDTNILDVEV